MGQYNKQGLYNGYKKNSKERAADDFYATPKIEVENALEAMKINLHNKVILEPSCGAGHMIQGIDSYLTAHGQIPKNKIGTDFKFRGFISSSWDLHYDLDTLADDYPFDKADVIIMNPPYSTLEPFLIRALEIADEVIVLCRTQVLEGASRYENIFQENPPIEIYQYIERIQCWKDGIKPTGSSAQAYCWLRFKRGNKEAPKLKWIHRSEKY